MVATTSGGKPNYFFAVFGADPSKPSVDGGVYPLLRGDVVRSGIIVGDVLLLYEAPLSFQGIGVVTGIETSDQKGLMDINYQYFPLCHPVHWSSLGALRKTILDLRTPLSSSRNLLQPISNTSFRAAIAGRQVDWP
jgi:hypothetical protein